MNKSLDHLGPFYGTRGFLLSFLLLDVVYQHQNSQTFTRLGTSVPIGSMYGIFAYIWLIFMGNVDRYTIHGSYGLRFWKTWEPPRNSLEKAPPNRLYPNIPFISKGLNPIGYKQPGSITTSGLLRMEKSFGFPTHFEALKLEPDRLEAWLSLGFPADTMGVFTMGRHPGKTLLEVVKCEGETWAVGKLIWVTWVETAKLA